MVADTGACTLSKLVKLHSLTRKLCLDKADLKNNGLRAGEEGEELVSEAQNCPERCQYTPLRTQAPGSREKVRGGPGAAPWGPALPVQCGLRGPRTT